MFKDQTHMRKFDVASFLWKLTVSGNGRLIDLIKIWNDGGETLMLVGGGMQIENNALCIPCYFESNRIFNKNCVN